MISTVKVKLLFGFLVFVASLISLMHFKEADVIIIPVQRNLSMTYKGELEHKNLIPLNDSDMIGSLLVILGLMLAASGGIGGGGILVPLLIIVFKFNPKHAIPLSNFTILGSSVTNILMNLSKRHPGADRPLVDWDMILVMEPLTMAGAVSLYIIRFIHLSVRLKRF